MSKKRYPYFKCRVCELIKKDNVNQCILRDFAGRITRCNYGTFFSIWKWLVRGVGGGLALGLLRWYIKYGIPGTMLVFNDPMGPPTGPKVLGALMSLVVLGCVLGIIGCIHDKFKRLGGKYF